MKQDTEKIKYFAYIRKSTEGEERQILSIPAQKEKIEELFSGFDIKYVEESRSAFLPYNRPALADMIQRMKRGERRGLIAWHPDRLSRNEIDAAEITYMIRTGGIKDLSFGSYNFDNSPEGIWMLQMALSQSQYSSAKLAKDVKRGIDKKAGLGWRPCLAPLGYSNSKIKLKGEQDISNDPDRFDLVKQLWQKMLTGNYSVPKLRKIVNKELGLTMHATRKRPERKLHLSVLYRVFTNPFYYGWYEWPRGSSNWEKGNHEAMITEEEFDRVQYLLGRKGKPRPKHHKFAFTGLMRCGSCDAMITAEEKFKKQKNGNVHHYIYYHCTKKKNPDCIEKSVELKELTNQIDKTLKGISISEKFKDWAIEYLHEIRKEEAKANEDTIKLKQNRYESVVKQLDNLLLSYTSPENSHRELMSDQEYAGLRSRLLKEKHKLEAELKDEGEKIEEWLELSERTFNFACYARVWFKKGDMDTKRAIFGCLGSDLILKGQKVSLDLHKPLQIIFDGLPQAKEELLRLEPLENRTNKRKTEVFASEFPIMSG